MATRAGAATPEPQGEGAGGPLPVRHDAVDEELAAVGGHLTDGAPGGTVAAAGRPKHAPQRVPQHHCLPHPCQLLGDDVKVLSELYAWRKGSQGRFQRWRPQQAACAKVHAGHAVRTLLACRPMQTVSQSRW